MSTESSSAEQTEAFVSLLTSAQDSLYRYVLSLVAGQHDRAKDLLQETNLVIWRKSSEFRMGTDFGAWARRIAYFCVMADIREGKRKPMLFNEQLVNVLAEEYEQQSQEVAERRSWLQECLTGLPAIQSRLIRSRYADDQSVSEISRQQGRSAGAIAAALYRIRLALLDCVNRKAAAK